MGSQAADFMSQKGKTGLLWSQCVLVGAQQKTPVSSDSSH